MVKNQLILLNEFFNIIIINTEIGAIDEVMEVIKYAKVSRIGQAVASPHVGEVVGCR
jgi:hypothetical protein